MIHGTYWPSQKVAIGRPFSCTEDRFAERLRPPIVTTDKRSVGGFGLGTFRNHHRSNADCLSVSAIGIDIDTSCPPFDDLVRSLEKQACIAHSTFSSEPKVPRVRIFFFISRTMSAKEHALVWNFLAQRSADGGVTVDPSAKDASRFWSLPVARPGAEFRFARTTGRPLDVDAILASVPAPPPPSSRPAMSFPTEGTLIDRVERARLYAMHCDPAISGQGGHATTFRTALKIIRGFDLSLDVGYQILLWHYNPRCLPPWSERELLHKAKQAAEHGRLPTGAILERGARGSA